MSQYKPMDRVLFFFKEEFHDCVITNFDYTNGWYYISRVDRKYLHDGENFISSMWVTERDIKLNVGYYRIKNINKIIGNGTKRG